MQQVDNPYLALMRWEKRMGIRTMQQVDETYLEIVRWGLKYIKQAGAQEEDLQRIRRHLGRENYKWAILNYRYLILDIIYTSKDDSHPFINMLKHKEYVENVTFKYGTFFRQSEKAMLIGTIANEYIYECERDYRLAQSVGTAKSWPKEVSHKGLNWKLFNTLHTEFDRFGVPDQERVNIKLSATSDEEYKIYINYATLIFRLIKQQTFSNLIGDTIPKDITADNILDICFRLIRSRVLTNNQIAKLKMLSTQEEYYEAFALDVLARALNPEKFMLEEYSV